MARIRENQRRSRTQRRELIQDLQTRVREFELKGVAATHEMQKAARKVALENERLRTLLAHHGVPKTKVEAYLQSFEDSADTTISFSEATNLSGACQGAARETLSNTRVSDARCYDPLLRGDPYPSAPPTTSYRQRVVEKHVSSAMPPEMPSGQCRSDGQTIPECFRSADDYDDTCTIRRPGHAVNSHVDEECANTVDCFCPPQTTAAQNIESSQSGVEISCETAAAIIAEMRGDDDRDAIRVSLGCLGRDTCNVKNSMVLQVMSER